MSGWQLLACGVQLAGAGVLACRVAAMLHGVTPFWVFAQHAGLSFALFVGSLLTFIAPDVGQAVVAVGVLFFFLASAHRWRFALPVDLASKPGDFDDMPHHWAANERN